MTYGLKQDLWFIPPRKTADELAAEYHRVKAEGGQLYCHPNFPNIPLIRSVDDWLRRECEHYGHGYETVLELANGGNP